MYNNEIYVMLYVSINNVLNKIINTFIYNLIRL